MGEEEALRRILQHWEMRQELYTSDAECAAGMADIARLSLASGSRQGRHLGEGRDG